MRLISRQSQSRQVHLPLFGLPERILNLSSRLRCSGQLPPVSFPVSFLHPPAIARSLSASRIRPTEKPRQAGLFCWPTRKDSEPILAPSVLGAIASGIFSRQFPSSPGNCTKSLGLTNSPTEKPRQAGLFCWPTRKDSNLRPSESESDALSSCATGSDARKSFPNTGIIPQSCQNCNPFLKKSIRQFPHS